MISTAAAPYSSSETCLETTSTIGYNSLKHDFDNPLYGPGGTKVTTETLNNKYPLEQTLEVPNLFYKEFRDPKSEAGSNRSSKSSLESGEISRPRLDTFPYVLDGEDSLKTNNIQQRRDRIVDIVYESTDKVSRGQPITTGAAAGVAQASDNDTSQVVELYDDVQTLNAASVAQAQYEDVRVLGKASSLTPETIVQTKAQKPFDNEIYDQPFSAVSPQVLEAVDNPGYANTG